MIVLREQDKQIGKGFCDSSWEVGLKGGGSDKKSIKFKWINYLNINIEYYKKN